MIRYRPAGLDDAAEIHALLLKLAPEMPLLVDTLEREEALYVLARNCARSGQSWVACDDTNRIVGFVLVEPTQHGRHYAEHEILELHHAGVATEHRNQGIFAALVAKVQARMVPVTASVPPQNKSETARRLEKLGFRAVGDARLRWEPGKST
ncbi:MAG TPA: GNAT family N-acetyltransferase [Stellaceae bacterium]|nr:GNAT family N-acetyltransferase [Stellaceae bacterium]